MSKIKKWLQNPTDYEAGVLLYESHGDNNALKRILRSGPSVFNQEKLYKELLAFEERMDEFNQNLPIQIQNSGPIVSKKKAAPSAEFLALETETKRHYAELAFLKGQIKHKEKKEREAACLNIINDFYNVLHPAFERLEFYRIHDRFPDEEITVDIKDNDPVSLVKKRNNLRSYLSKAEKGSMKQEKVPQWQAELAEIERKLSAF